MKTWFNRRTGLVLAATALAAGVGIAQPGAFGGKHHGPGRDGAFGQPRIERMAQELGLSEAQKTQLKSLQEQHKSAMQQQMQARQQLRMQQMAAMNAATPDRNQLEALRQQELRLHDAASKARMEQQLAVAQILTPEQRQKMAAKRAQRHAERMQRMGAGAAPAGERGWN